MTATDPTGLYWELHRPTLRRAAYYQYSRGRMSYRSYYYIYNARWIRWRNLTFHQTVWFYSTDSCIGATAASAVGLVAFGIIDTGVGIANILVLGSFVGAVAMVPVDAAAVAGTYSMYSILEQSTHNNCDNIHWKWPWE